MSHLNKKLALGFALIGISPLLAVGVAFAADEEGNGNLSTHTGKAKYKDGYVILPDGRRAKVPEEYMRRIPDGTDLTEFEAEGKTDTDAVEEVAKVTQEMVSEASAGHAGDTRINPAQMKGSQVQLGNRSTHTGVAKYQDGYVVLPDGRRAKVPEEIVQKIPPGSDAMEFSELESTDESFKEVAKVANEMVAEASSKRTGAEQVINPAELKGRQIQETAPKDVQQIQPKGVQQMNPKDVQMNPQQVPTR